MYAAHRHRTILDQLAATGRVSVAELAEQLEVTTETIRRDLDGLADRSLLVRVHGGGVSPETVAEADPGTRSSLHVSAKRRIAERAAALLPTDAAAPVLLDAGTTTAALVPHLGGRTGPILTNDPAIAQACLDVEGLTVHLLPGRLRAETRSAVGPATIEALERLRPALAVLGCNGMDDEGFSTPDPDEGAVKTMMAGRADRRIVLADASKLGRRHLVLFAPAADVDIVVTEAQVPATTATAWSAAGLEVLPA